MIAIILLKPQILLKSVFMKEIRPGLCGESFLQSRTALTACSYQFLVFSTPHKKPRSHFIMLNTVWNISGIATNYEML